MFLLWLRCYNRKKIRRQTIGVATRIRTAAQPREGYRVAVVFEDRRRRADELQKPPRVEEVRGEHDEGVALDVQMFSVFHQLEILENPVVHLSLQLLG